jgi:hypothetical protein
MHTGDSDRRERDFQNWRGGNQPASFFQDHGQRRSRDASQQLAASAVFMIGMVVM